MLHLQGTQRKRPVSSALNLFRDAAPSVRKPSGASGAVPFAALAASRQQPDTQSHLFSSNDSIVPYSSTGSRRMILGTDHASYAKNGQMIVGTPARSPAAVVPAPPWWTTAAIRGNPGVRCSTPT